MSHTTPSPDAAATRALRDAEQAANAGNVADAIERYGAIVLSQDPHVAYWANRNIASLYVKAGYIDKAIHHAGVAWSLQHRPDTGLLLASLFRRTRQFPKAYAVLETMFQEMPRNADALVLYADTIRAEGGTVLRAYTYLTRAVELNDRHYWARRNAGTSLLRLGHPKAALAQLEAAKALRPEDASILVDLGDAYFQTGEVQRSLACFCTLADASENIKVGVLTAQYCEEGDFNFLSGWVITKQSIESMRLTAAGRSIEYERTPPPIPISRRWAGTSFADRRGFISYFQWQPGEESVSLELAIDGTIGSVFMELRRREAFKTVAAQSLLKAAIPSQGHTLADRLAFARALHKHSMLDLAAYYLYQLCDFPRRLTLQEELLKASFLLLETLVRANRFAEAEAVCLHMLGRLAEMPVLEANHAIEMYGFCFALRSGCNGLNELSEKMKNLLGRPDKQGRSGALINLGHMAVLSNEYAKAKELYAMALQDYDGLPVHFNRGIRAFCEAPDIAELETLPFRAALRCFPSPSFSQDDADGPVDLVHLIACDAKYFDRFVPNLVRTFPSNSTLRVGLHIHLINPSTDNLATLEAIRGLPGYSRIDLSIERMRIPSSEATERAYYTMPRFLIAPLVVRRYACPVLITETDCVMNWAWKDLLLWSRNGCVGLMLKEADRTLSPGSKVPAAAVFLDGSPESRAYMELASKYMAAAFNFESNMNWTIDQLALWAAYDFLRAKTSFFNIEKEIILVPRADKDLWVGRTAADRATIDAQS